VRNAPRCIERAFYAAVLLVPYVVAAEGRALEQALRKRWASMRRHLFALLVLVFLGGLVTNGPGAPCGA